MEENPLVALGQRIREARKRRGLRLEDVAGQVGINYATVSAYERGRAAPGVDKLRQIAQLLGVSADWLLGIGEPSSEVSPTEDAKFRELVTLFEEAKAHLSAENIRILRRMAKALAQDAHNDEQAATISPI